jgi:hypothetical protein
MSWQVKAIALLVTAAVPAVAWRYLSSGPAGESVTMDRELASSASLVVAEEPLEFKPKAGSIYGYKFQRIIKITGLDNSIPPIEFSGEMRLHVTEVKEKSFIALVTEQVDGQPSNKVALRIQAALRGDQLQIFSAKPESEIDQQHISVAKDLLSLLFFPLRSDTTGNFQATFEALADEGEFKRLKKVKLAYLKPAPAKIVSSSHILKWKKSLSMPEEVKGKDESALGSGEITSESSYQLKLSGVWIATAPADYAALTHAETLAIQPTKISLKDHPDYAKLDWGEISARLRSIARLSSSEQLALFGDLVKYLELDPSRIREIVALLRAERVRGAASPLFQQVIGALATNGSPEAQAALVAIYQDPAIAVSGKGSILSALTTTQAALDLATRDFLAQTMASEQNKDLAMGAAFALGASLEKAPDDEQARDAVQRILAAWDASANSSIQDRLALLDVMGNSGRLEFFSAIATALRTSKESELRARSAFSLRFIASPSARELLASALNDADVGVRSGAAFAIQLAAWNEIFRTPVSSCSLNELDTQIRKICLEVHNRHSAVAQAY